MFNYFNAIESLTSVLEHDLGCIVSYELDEDADAKAVFYNDPMHGFCIDLKEAYEYERKALTLLAHEAVHLLQTRKKGLLGIEVPEFIKRYVDVLYAAAPTSVKELEYEAIFLEVSPIRVLNLLLSEAGEEVVPLSAYKLEPDFTSHYSYAFNYESGLDDLFDLAPSEPNGLGDF